MTARPWLAALITVAATSCNLADALTPKSSLSPARQLEGTWKTAVPVTFYYQTNYCGSKQTVAQSQWDVTWTVTAVSGYDNVLDIQMRFTRTGSTAVASTCGNGANGWVPLVSPTFLEATLSSSAITAYEKSSGISVPGSFTTDLMMLTWNHYECILYCTGEFTKAQEFKLVRQR